MLPITRVKREGKELSVVLIAAHRADMILGHVSSATTVDIYSHITTGMQRAAAEKMIEEVRARIREDKARLKAEAGGSESASG